MACKACVEHKLHEANKTRLVLNNLSGYKQARRLTTETFENLRNQELLEIIKIMNEKCKECPSE